MCKKLVNFIFNCVLLTLFISQCYAKGGTLETVARIPVPVEVSVNNQNWNTTIKICNKTSQAIPLNDIELTFNYQNKIGDSVWGTPWVDWKIAKDGPGEVQLLGGTQWAPALQPDPNCSNPMTVVFVAGPDVALPTGPFVFKAATTSTPPGDGKVNVIMPAAPATGLSNPRVTIAGMGLSQSQVVAWGMEWLISNVVPGNYTVTASNVDNGSDFFQAAAQSVAVQAGQTASVTMKYERTSSAQGNLNITLPSAPATGASNPTITVNGNGVNQEKVVTWGTQWLLPNLPAGSYTVTSSSVTSGSTVYRASPVTVSVTAGATAQASLTYSASSQPGRPAAWDKIKHVVIIILENEKLRDSLAQPFMRSLTTKGALTSKLYALTHPSQPNYIGLTAGSLHGVRSNSDVNLNVKHIGDLLEAKGLTWKAYAEDLPSTPCFKGDSGKYDRKHEPFISYTNVQNNAKRCANIVNANQFFTDLAAKRLPTYSFYVPNENNNGHDTGVAYADKWLQRVWGPIFNDSQATADTLFIVTYDEDDSSADNLIYTAFVGAGVKSGANSTKRYTLYSVLRTIEEIYQLGNLGQNDANAVIIDDIWES